MEELPYTKVYQRLTHSLKTVYPPGEASAMARMVLEDLTGVSAGQALLADGMMIGLSQLQNLTHIESALLNQEPIQYVLGHADFLDFRLMVNADVLIPRPETEELAQWIIEAHSTGTKHPATVLDIGTGSGCLALALKATFPEAEVVAADVSPAALQVAQKNAEKYDLDLSFLQLDILQAQPDSLLPELDLVVSNPPYILPAEAAAMLPNVLDHEPHAALFVTDGDPLQFYRAIERFCHGRLAREGSVYLELNAAQATAIEAYYQNQGWNTVLKRDFQGQPRMLKAFRRV